MKNDWLCKCKHLKSFHNLYFPAYQWNNGQVSPAVETACSICCSFIKCYAYYPISNLEYLEEKSCTEAKDVMAEPINQLSSR